MADPREDILVRLKALAVALGTFADVQRNPRNVDDMDLPALAIWDGEEHRHTEDDQATRKSGGVAVITMIPQLFVKVKGRPEDVGTALNAFRKALFDAVLLDTTLNAASQPRGCGIRYMGATFDPGYGESTIGQMTLSFSFTYALEPTA